MQFALRQKCVYTESEMFAASSQPYMRQQLFRFLDPLMLTSAMVIIGYWRWGHLPRGEDIIPAVCLGLLSLLIFQINGTYDVLTSQKLSEWCKRPIVALIISFFTCLAIAYMLKVSEDFSRIVFVGWAITSIFLVFSSRILIYRLMILYQKKGIGLDRTILVGNPDQCFAFFGHCSQHPECGVQVVGISCDSLKTQEGAGISVAPLNEIATMVDKLAVRE